jgi:hypothetical protein
MRRFFEDLYNRLRQSNMSRATSRRPRRASLGLESLENRLVPTSVSLTSGVLNIYNVAPGHAIELACNANNNNEIEVYDISNSAAVVFQANKQTINTINIRLGSNGGLSIDDSNGMPFAANTLVSISGSGTGNALGIGGSRTVTGNETYVPGSGSSAAKLSVDNSTIDFTSTINAFTDFLPITGTDDVQASGTNVVLGKFSGTLTGLSTGAGGSLLNFANKPTVQLDENAANATIHLNGVAENSQSLFEVNLHGAGDSTIIAATPVGVVTEVQTDIAPVANSASVILDANTGPVVVNGNSSTALRIGQQLSNGLFSTQGIQGNVTVQGAGSLSLLDNGNNSTAQNVTVTEKSVSGTGLFGNNNVVLSYGGVTNLSIDSGQLADQYTVEGSGPYVEFSTKISLTDSSNTSFRADVYAGIFNDLNLSLFNTTPVAAAQLFIHTISSQTVSNPTPLQGVVDVTFAGVFTDQISYDGFTPVVVQG